jgi:all-trans-retinol 13,14-reductase
VLSLFLSVDEPPETFAAVSEGHLFYSPDAAGLGDLHTRGLEDLLARHADGPLPEEPVKAYLDAFFARTTYEVSIPVLKDPALAPPGKTGLIVSTLFDYTLTRRIQEAGWYDAFREHAPTP